jgi:rod shape determining protein RodA
MKKVFFSTKYFLKHSDMFLFSMCCICAIFGIVVINSATQSYGNPQRYVAIQVIALILGIIAYIILTVIDSEIIANQWIYLCIFNVVILFLLIPFGVEGGTGNRSWFRFFGVGLQPTEVIKITFIIILAKQTSYLKEYKNLNSPWSVAQLVLHFIVLFALIELISSDLGSDLIIMFIFIIILFIAGISWLWIALGIGILAAFVPIAWNYFLKDYQKNRILAPYDSSIDPTGDSYMWQANQSKMALASGKLTGVGLGNGPQSQSEALAGKHTDFIFAVIGEELGMIACVIVIILLVAIIIRCCVVGIHSGSNFDLFLCFGVAATIAFQTFINIGMCMGITPVIGVTLPFFSYGGSSMVTLFAAMGLVSGVKYRPKPARFRIKTYN